ncbi:MAG: hypothetical protein COB02_02130 [Candidatus Cloacimonadota bacterium]|nr:MAG: hypothetical protein COB02_02130 [Candidatus Cloacimonadota bacterium]
MNKKYKILLAFVWLFSFSINQTSAQDFTESWDLFASRWSKKFSERREKFGIKSITKTPIATKVSIQSKAIFDDNFLGKIEKSMSTPIQIFQQLGKTKDRLNGKNFKWFNPNLVKFNGFKRTIGNTFHYIKNVDSKKYLDVFFNYAELKMKAPYEIMQLQTMDAGMGLHELLSAKWRMSMSAGVKRYVPNYFYRDFFTQKSQTFESKSIPYLSVNLGYKLLDKILMINRPLVLNFGYTMADDFKYPSADPFNYDNISFKGFHIGLKLRFKI